MKVPLEEQRLRHGRRLDYLQYIMQSSSEDSSSDGFHVTLEKDTRKSKILRKASNISKFLNNAKRDSKPANSPQARRPTINFRKSTTMNLKTNQSEEASQKKSNKRFSKGYTLAGQRVSKFFR